MFGWVKMFSAQSKRKITALKCQAARLANQSWSWIIEKPVDCKFSCPFLLGVSMTTLCAAVVIAAIIVEVMLPLFPPPFLLAWTTAQSAQVLTDFQLSTTSQQLDPSHSETHRGRHVLRLECLWSTSSARPFLPRPNTRDTSPSPNMLYWLDSHEIMEAAGCVMQLLLQNKVLMKKGNKFVLNTQQRSQSHSPLVFPCSLYFLLAITTPLQVHLQPCQQSFLWQMTTPANVWNACCSSEGISIPCNAISSCHCQSASEIG